MTALTAFNPAQHTAEAFAQATVAQRPGFTLEPGSSVLRFGTSSVGSGSLFSGLTQAQIDALLADPVALAAFFTALPPTSSTATQSSIAFYDGSISGLGCC